jgi:hypothetical protein
MSNNFYHEFVDQYKLPTLTHDTVVIQYKVLTMTTTVCKTIGDDSSSNVTTSFSWSIPTKITKLINNSNDDFYNMISVFTTKSLKLEDIATQAYVVNGPAGVGKTHYY